MIKKKKQFKNLNEYAKILVDDSLTKMIVNTAELNVSTENEIEIIIKGYKKEKKI